MGIQFPLRIPELLSQVSLLVLLSLCSLLLFLNLLLYFDTNLFLIPLRIASTFRSLHIYNFYNLICSCLLNYVYLSFFLFLCYSLYYFLIYSYFETQISCLLKSLCICRFVLYNIF